MNNFTTAETINKGYQLKQILQICLNSSYNINCKV